MKWAVLARGHLKQGMRVSIMLEILNFSNFIFWRLR